MSGHSKWSTIKRQKAAGDLRRGEVFTKLGKAISIAVRESGGICDPEKNFRLRLAIEKAKKANMPKENIKRAVERGAGKLEGEAKLETVFYEGYGPFGVALMIEAVTNNRQRTGNKIKHFLQSAGGHLADPGSVSYLFTRQGVIVAAHNSLGGDEVLEKAVESGASDIEETEDAFEIYTQDNRLHEVAEKLRNSTLAGLKIIECELVFRPKSTVLIEEKEKAEKILKLTQSLEQLDDVQKVYANFEIAKKF